MPKKKTATRISIFNHKGGVGKTTLTWNIATALAATGSRVLLVDSDPQCNLTSYLLEEAVVDDLLDNSDGSEGRTVWSALKPISTGQGQLKVIEPFSLPKSGMYLVPGDVRLSEFEADLGDFWNDCLARRERGFRGITALSRLITEICDSLDIDYVFYDSGPNVGPLNRIILLDCDYFVVPVACDLFSLRALRTLGRTLSDWIRTWETIRSLAPSGLPLLDGRPAFMGFIPQQFRIYRGAVVAAQQGFLARIEKEITTELVTELGKIDRDLVPKSRSYRIGTLKNFGVLVTESQREGEPIYLVNAGTEDQRT